MPGDFLDLILLALAAGFALAGYRQGFIIGVLSLAGFIGGVAIGALIAPPVSRTLGGSTQWQSFVAILVLFASAVFGMVIASAIGVAVRSRLTGRPAAFVDSVGGAAVNVVSVLIVAWLIGSLVTGSFPTVTRQVNDSVVLRTVDGLMPRSVLYLPVFPPLRTLMNNGLYSPVFSALGAETTINLPAPASSVLASPEVRADERSVVKIVGVAPVCSLKIEGSGFVIAPGRVLTNAHVVAGVTEGLQVSGPDGRAYVGRVVLYDPNRDIAVLDVPGLAAPALKFAGAAPFSSSAVVAGYPENHPLTLSPARVGRGIDASGPNIYQRATVQRQVYPIRAVVQPGNSGGPLLAPDGKVYGVVFAASTSIKDIGYALAAGEIAGDVRAGEQAATTVSTQACQP